ncbi:hypothetical protein A0H76_2469 [Hepatospora eriocheir]|uniref:Uncharacterized protein n=1 Tax=Hepatospora eriocheir TaxID=1081669 RepID=A0A1X0QJV6_9MICR|nr:hypothetical protein A0H76_2469 [Hepatospora eriocheir]
MKSNQNIFSKKSHYVIDAQLRKTDSLLDKDLKFDTAVINIPVSKDEDEEIMKYLIQRFKEKTFDNFKMEQINEISEEKEVKIELCKDNEQILELWDDLETTLDNLTKSL